MLHGIVNGKSCRHVTTRAVDIQRDILLRVLVLKENQLRHDVVRHFIVDGRTQEDDALLEEAGVDVVGAFTTPGGLNDGRNDH